LNKSIKVAGQYLVSVTPNQALSGLGKEKIRKKKEE
jgi:hypothetical protein